MPNENRVHTTRPAGGAVINAAQSVFSAMRCVRSDISSVRIEATAALIEQAVRPDAIGAAARTFLTEHFGAVVVLEGEDAEHPARYELVLDMPQPANDTRPVKI